MSLMDWSPPTPRSPQQGPACRQDATRPPVASCRPLSFAHVGGGIIWQTYPGHLHLTIEQAEAVKDEVREEVIRTCLSGGGVSGAVSMLAELLEAINTARRWRKAGGY